MGVTVVFVVYLVFAVLRACACAELSPPSILRSGRKRVNTSHTQVHITSQ